MAFCRYCGSNIEPGNKFCMRCGAAVEDTSKPEPPSPSYAPPSYSPPPSRPPQAQPQWQQPAPSWANPQGPAPYQSPYYSAPPAKGITVGRIILLIGAVLALVAYFLPWFTFRGDLNAWDAMRAYWEMLLGSFGRGIDILDGWIPFIAVLAMLAAAGIIILIFLLTLAFSRSGGERSAVIFFAIIGLAAAAVWLILFLTRNPGISIGYGAYVGIGGYAVALISSFVK